MYIFKPQSMDKFENGKGMNLKYCEHCTKKLKVLDIAFELYQNICECYLLEGKPFSLANLGVLEFSLSSLERKGFLVTTEDDNATITIKPLGIHLFEENTFICPGICERKGITK